MVVARIHYEIPDDLHRRAKSAAALQGITLKDFVIHALEQATTTPQAKSRRG
jgi:predicted HicB family RNase H-like nuclease